MVECMGAVRLAPGDLTLSARKFLAAYSACGSLHKAAEIVGSVIGSHYVWMQNPKYVAAFEEAHRKSIDELTQAARTRAVEGIQVPVYQQGMLVGYKQVYSDALLMFLLKGLDKERFGDHVTSENVNKNLNANANLNIDLSKLTPDELRLLDSLAAKLGGGGATAPSPDPGGTGKP